MLTTFPALLTYSFFAPTILRFAAALVLAYLAYYHYTHKEAVARTRFPIMGEGMWIAWLAILVEGIVALGLLLGYHTQISAIIGALIALKIAFWSGTYPTFFVFSRSTGFLLLVICLSLLISGGGALAFDLPL
ncbi:MAG TPA: hypothetical protein VHD31_00370 [Candidatus Paceibacterota bacterium]|nr:hypothetical protein [Candidatus Paceibacterota bacterium]